MSGIILSLSRIEKWTFPSESIRVQWIRWTPSERLSTPSSNMSGIFLRIHLVGLYTNRLPVFRWKARGYDWILVDSIGQPSLILLSDSPRASQNLNPVHSEILFSQRFFCLPLLLPPCTVPCKIVLASPADLGTCPNHFNQCLTWRRCIACTKTDIRQKAAGVRKRKSGKN